MSKREQSAQEQAVRDAAVEADRAAYEDTGDAWHVWSALGRYRAEEPLPLWIRRYLLRSAAELLTLQFMPAKAQDATRAIPRALQLAGSITNARWWREATFLSALHSLAQKRDGFGRPRRGESQRVALELAKVYDLSDQYSVYRIIGKVRERRKLALKRRRATIDG